MEGKTHSSKIYAVAGQKSRIAGDLEDCSKDFQLPYQPQHPIRQRVTDSKAKPLSILVIGAGLAGLRCAQVLARTGVHVTVFEARDRIGGRVCQESLNGRLVDMGPNWVHGTESNPIVRLAAETKTKITSLGEKSVYFGSDGKPVDEERVERLDDIIWGIIGEAFAHSNKSCAEIAPQLSLRDWFEEKLPLLGLNAEDNALAMQMAQLWGSFIGDSWEKQSLKYFWLEECLDGENLYIVDSHKAIVDEIAGSLTADTLHLGIKATHVESQTGEEQDPSLRITAIRNGEEVRYEDFDEVVISVPMGCLKRDALEFQPALPDGIRKAIANASISSLEKVYLVFARAFWDRPTPPSDEDDANKANGDSAAAGPLPGFVNFLNPTAYAPSRHRSWCLEVNALSNTKDFGEHAQPVLLFSMFGDCGHDLAKRIDGLSPMSQEYFHTINNFLNPYYSRLPNYTPDDPACTPEAVLATNWQNDEYAYGSYTNFKVHSPDRDVELDQEVRVMRHGMPDRGIWFAGEHVAPFVGLGTSTGAYWSGEMAAMKILSANGLAEKVADAASS